jgi:homoserine kinase type II
MAVYTEISREEVGAWLDSNFEIGSVAYFEGIRGGIENTNYFLDTDLQGQTYQYVLTIFERLDATQLPYYLNLMLHLAKNNIRVPKPIENRQGNILQNLKKKPAAIVTKLEGSSQLDPNTQHCAQVGDMLAKMHLAGKSFPHHQENLRSLSWWKTASTEILPFLDEQKRILLSSELLAQERFFDSGQYFTLPEGACHCDLFRDNALFNNQNELSGFFDFYFAGHDKWLFDVAVTANDWCIHLPTGEFDNDRLKSLLHAYQKIRPFDESELNAWSMMLRAAALRFWISRLWDFYIPRDAKLLTPHDPTHFERILRLRISAHAN